MRRAAASAVLVLTLGSVSASALEWPGRAEAVATSIERAMDEDARAERVSDVAGLHREAAVPLLRGLLDDPAPVVRASACTTAGLTAARELVPDVLERLADQDATVRAAAAAALGHLRDRSAHEALARAVADPDTEVRAAAVEALAQIGAPEAFATIVGALSDRDRTVVVASLTALGELGRPEAVYALLDRADDPSTEVAEAAVRSLADLGAPEAVPTFVRLARHGPVAVSLAAMDAAVDARATAVSPSLATEVLSPRTRDTRVAALDGLTTLADPSQRDRLAPLLRQQPELVADYFIALGDVGAASLHEAWRASSSPSAREQLFEAWVRSGDVHALDELAVLAGRAEASEVRQMFEQSPAPEAVCRAAELVSTPEDAGEWIRWAAARDALACVPSAWIASATLDAEARVLMTASWLRSGAAERAAQSLPASSTPWEELAEVLAASASAGADAAPVLEALLYWDDSRVRREAAMMLGELDVLERSLDAPWLRPDTLYAARPWLTDPAVREQLSRRPGAGAVGASWLLLTARDCLERPQPPGESFALTRARAIARVHCGEELDAWSTDSVERSAATSTLHDLDVVRQRWSDSSALVRAAALLRWSELDPEEAQTVAWNARLSDEVPVAAAAAWVWAAGADVAPGRVERAARGETDPAVAAALRSGLRARSASASPQHEPDVVWVYAVDEEQGTPRPDAVVIAVPAAGPPRFSATGADGVTLMRAAPSAFIHVVGER